MDEALFSPQSPGRLVSTIQGVSAFVPDNLPPDIDRAALFDVYGDAMAALGMLNAKIAQLANPKLIIRPLQKREALASSAMEGTFTTGDELALLDAGAESAVRPETTEVRNYARALSQTVETLATLPISHRMIQNAHAILMDGLTTVRGGNKRSGEYKKDQNWIGGATIQAARFVPAPPKEADEAMNMLERFINREAPEAIPPLIEAAIVHYQFETIHPFSDGNGRVGRILIPIILMARKAMAAPVFYPSAVLENRKDEYIDRMFAVSTSGDWTGWIAFFLGICAQTCRISIGVVDSLFQLQQEYRRRVMGNSRSNNPLIIIDELFSSPVISTPMARDRLSVSHRAARQTIALLERLEILEKMQGFNMPEYFIARGILRAST